MDILLGSLMITSPELRSTWIPENTEKEVGRQIRGGEKSLPKLQTLALVRLERIRWGHKLLLEIMGKYISRRKNIQHNLLSDISLSHLLIGGFYLYSLYFVQNGDSYCSYLPWGQTSFMSLMHYLSIVKSPVSHS